MNTPFDLLASRLHKLKEIKAYSGERRAIALCPAHDDHNPSLALRELQDGRLLIHCRFGCGGVEVVRSIGLELKDLYPRAYSPPEKSGRRASKMRNFINIREVVKAIHLLLVADAISHALPDDIRMRMAKIAGEIDGCEVLS